MRSISIERSALSPDPPAGTGTTARVLDCDPLLPSEPVPPCDAAAICPLLASLVAGPLSEAVPAAGWSDESVPLVAVSLPPVPAADDGSDDGSVVASDLTSGCSAPDPSVPPDPVLPDPVAPAAGAVSTCTGATTTPVSPPG